MNYANIIKTAARKMYRESKYNLMAETLDAHGEHLTRDGAIEVLDTMQDADKTRIGRDAVHAAIKQIHDPRFA